MYCFTKCFTVSNYRYGFNGKEKYKNINSLTAYDYGFRIYNPAIGKFLSVDPLTKSYPELTPYQFASNTPIQAIDLDGLEAKYVNGPPSGQFDITPGKEGGFKKLRQLSGKGSSTSAYFEIIDANGVNMFINVRTTTEDVTTFAGTYKKQTRHFSYYDQAPKMVGQGEYEGASWVPFTEEGDNRTQGIYNTADNLAIGCDTCRCMWRSIISIIFKN
jgi:RHS repeat-associated protein